MKRYYSSSSSLFRWSRVSPSFHSSSSKEEVTLLFIVFFKRVFLIKIIDRYILGVFGWLVGTTNLFTSSKTDTSLGESTTRPREDDDDERRKKQKNGARDLVSDHVMAARYFTRCAAAGTGRAGVERAESDVRSARVDVWTTIDDGVDWFTRTNFKSDIIRGR